MSEEERGIWEYVAPERWDDSAIAVTAHAGGLTIEVTQEKAVDSYNQIFTCSISLPNSAVRDLLGFVGQFDWSEAADPPSDNGSDP